MAEDPFELWERLPPVSLDRIAGEVVEGYLSGRHRSRDHGFSVEYLDHRPYSPGDPPRTIDWRLFARTDQYYIKRHRDETNRVVHLLVDTSASMRFPEGVTRTKWRFSVTLAAALAQLFLSQHDAVGCVCFDAAMHTQVPPSSRPDQLRRLLAALQEGPRGETTGLAEVLHDFASQNRPRGLVILLSDLLAPLGQWVAALEHLRHSKHAVLLLQPLSDLECDLPGDGPTRFLDPEGDQHATLDPAAVRGVYRARVRAWQEEIRQRASAVGVRFLPVRISQDPAEVLRSILQPRTVEQRG